MSSPPSPAPWPTPLGVLRLTDWGVIRASGEDARSFLHGQLTQDVQHLGATQARLAGYCSAKGRMLASFVVWSPTADEVLLACSADLLPAALKRLSMYVLRAKCKLSDASPVLALWGACGEGAGPEMDVWSRAATDGGSVIRLPDARHEDRAVPRWLHALPAAAGGPDLPSLDAAAWQWLEVHSGTPRIVAVTSEQFVPQMVNLDLVGGVSFQKGCYPGQEVVARSQYRGTLKRRAYVLDADAALMPGDDVFELSDPEQPAGKVVLAASLAGRHSALVEMKIAAMHAGELHAHNPGGARLRHTSQPYEIPVEAS